MTSTTRQSKRSNGSANKAIAVSTLTINSIASAILQGKVPQVTTASLKFLAGVDGANDILEKANKKSTGNSR